MSQMASTHEAVVMSGWGWKTHNVPERLAMALGRAGWRILYCENPASFIRRRKQGRVPLSEGVEGFWPRLVGHRLNALASGSKLQAKLLVRQILRQTREMGMTRPIVIYPHGPWVVDLARELKSRGITGIFVCMDHIDREESEALADASSLTLAIPRTTFSRLEARFGAKVRLIPQFGPDLDAAAAIPAESQALARVEQIPRPRLAYLGPPTIRLHADLMKSLFTAHPEWHFLACGPVPDLQLPNVHDIGWAGSKEIPVITRAVDAGLMPYDCGNEVNLHCVPLKLLDYFAAGLPVVSTPLLHLREYGNLVYLGDTAEELAAGIRRALAETPDDPRREERRRIAHSHSLDAMSKLLPSLLFDGVPCPRESQTDAGAVMSAENRKTSAARNSRLLVVPHIPATDIRVREIELARCLKNHFESVFCLEWSDALHDLSGGPVLRRWRQATRAIGAMTTPVGKPRIRDGIRHVNVPVLQPILLRRLIGDEAALGISRRVNIRCLNRLVKELGITHVLLATSIFGVPTAPRVETFFDFVDWFPEESASATQMSSQSRDMRWLASRVQGLFAVSEPLARKLRRDYGIDCAPLPNGTDIRGLRSVPQSEIDRIRARWDVGGKFVVGVIGNHGDYVPLDFAVRVFRRLRARMPDAALWIVGPAEIWRSRLEDEPGVIFTGQVPPEEVSAFFQAIDLGLLVQERNAGTEYAFQIKVVEYTACRKFVIAPPFETWRRLSWPNVRLLDFDPDAWAAEICSLREASWDGDWDGIVEPYDWSRLAAEAARIILHSGGE
jgi:glycosyltransferase involved in cell wall biosynthesis